jgi:hypothetical protein
MAGEPPDPTDANIAKWLMGDETTRQRMLDASSGPAGSAYREVLSPTVPGVWDRRVILCTLYRPYEMKTRMLGLLRGGISVEEIQEVILQVGFYVGMPTGVEATVTLHEVMENLTERGIPFNRHAQP